MKKRILMVFCIFAMLLSTAAVVIYAGGEPDTNAQNDLVVRCFMYCDKYKVIDYKDACLDGCVNGAK